MAFLGFAFCVDEAFLSQSIYNSDFKTKIPVNEK